VNDAVAIEQAQLVRVGLNTVFAASELELRGVERATPPLEFGRGLVGDDAVVRVQRRDALGNVIQAVQDVRLNLRRFAVERAVQGKLVRAAEHPAADVREEGNRHARRTQGGGVPLHVVRVQPAVEVVPEPVQNELAPRLAHVVRRRDVGVAAQFAVEQVRERAEVGIVFFQVRLPRGQV